MTTLTNLWNRLPVAVQARAKAVAAAVLAAAVAYVVAVGLNGVTWDGLWVALSTAAATALGVHQVPNKLTKQAAHRQLAGPDGHLIIKRRIPEIRVEGKPLGRHYHWDSRNENYLVPKMSRRDQRRMTAVRWPRRVPTFDQGSLGSCTGNATVGTLGTDPFYATLPNVAFTEDTAVSVYSDAEKLDGGQGYPPEDEGSTGQSTAKVVKARGWIGDYLHIASIAAAKTAIAKGPYWTGTNWLTGMDNPDANGLVTATGSLRGGHEYEVVGYDPATDLWEFINSWGNWGVTVDGEPGHFYMTSKDYGKLLAASGDGTVPTPIAAPIPGPAPADADRALAAELRHIIGLKSTSHTAKADFQAWLSAKGL